MPLLPRKTWAKMPHLCAWLSLRLHVGSAFGREVINPPLYGLLVAVFCVLSVEVKSDLGRASVAVSVVERILARHATGRVVDAVADDLAAAPDAKTGKRKAP